MARRGERLTRVRVGLPPGARYEEELLQARPLGGDLYELRSSPWFAFDLHLGDEVRAVAGGPGESPKVVAVVRRSGHQTLRILFDPTTAAAQRKAMLRVLQRWGASHEHCDGRLYVVDVEPDGDYEAVCKQLAAWAQQGNLVYETGTRGVADGPSQGTA
jgi:hypothetical protein